MDLRLEKKFDWCYTLWHGNAHLGDIYKEIGGEWLFDTRSAACFASQHLRVIADKLDEVEKANP